MNETTNPTLQLPASRDARVIRSQSRGQRRMAFGRLTLGAPLVLGCWCLLLVPPIPVEAQSYNLDWYTIDAGGGTSTGGVYSVTGSIGQADAEATMSGGVYSLTGGFWVLPTTVQKPDAPTLTIVPAKPAQACISWAPNTPGFVLQERASLSTGSWADAPSGTNNPAFVPTTFPARFYRLFKP